MKLPGSVGRRFGAPDGRRGWHHGALAATAECGAIKHQALGLGHGYQALSRQWARNRLHEGDNRALWQMGGVAAACSGCVLFVRPSVRTTRTQAHIHRHTDTNAHAHTHHATSHTCVFAHGHTRARPPHTHTCEDTALFSAGALFSAEHVRARELHAAAKAPRTKPWMARKLRRDASGEYRDSDEPPTPPPAPAPAPAATTPTAETGTLSAGTGTPEMRHALLLLYAGWLTARPRTMVLCRLRSRVLFQAPPARVPCPDHRR